MTALVARRWYGAPARMAVSGDIARDGVCDHELCEKLCRAARATGIGGVLAYGYTHCTDAPIADLRSAGIVLLRSDVCAPGGAIVCEHDRVPELRRASGVRVVACPAQREGSAVTCRVCKVCRESYERELCVAFAPHGVNKRRVLAWKGM